MEAEQVIEKILSDARAEAAKITKQAQQKQADKLSKLDEQLSEYQKETEILAQKKGEEKKAHMLAAARLETSKQYLAEKRKILDEVFTKSQEQFKLIKDSDYKKLMKKLLLNAIETGDEEVIIDKNETRIDLNFIKDINRELGPGFKGNLKLSKEKQDIGAGFILKRGKIKNNVSLPVLIEKARNALETELSKELFGN